MLYCAKMNNCEGAVCCVVRMLVSVRSEEVNGLQSVSTVSRFQRQVSTVPHDSYQHRLLKSPTCLKIATHLILCTLQGADIRLVDVMCYGTKSTPHVFTFLYKILQTPPNELWAVPNYAPVIYIDVGCSLSEVQVCSCSRTIEQQQHHKAASLS